jgi:formylglycine-generating enzyme required for sulfatase activity
MLLVSALVLMMSGLGYCNYPGDCNGDMVVDDFDFNAVIVNFGGPGPAGDCDGNGVVDDFDFNAVIVNFGTVYQNSNYTGVMVNIPAGEFQMGKSDLDSGGLNGAEPQHAVFLSAYSIGKYEVTRGDYKKFMDAGGYSNSAYWSTNGWTWKGSRTEPNFWAEHQDWGSPPTGGFDQSANYPVVGVSYYEAEAFCNWAGGHLPTEAQWEKAARWTGSHPNVYPWGDTWDALKCNNAGDSLNAYQTMPVGSYALGASPYGCMDMAGNVWEWCKDWYSASYYGSSPYTDPQGPSVPAPGWDMRVMRGGSWEYSDSQNRAAYRDYYDPWRSYNSFGFRLAR